MAPGGGRWSPRCCSSKAHAPPPETSPDRLSPPCPATGAATALLMLLLLVLLLLLPLPLPLLLLHSSVLDHHWALALGALVVADSDKGVHLLLWQRIQQRGALCMNMQEVCTQQLQSSSIRSDA